VLANAAAAIGYVATARDKAGNVKHRRGKLSV
jgi:hypothetical protein